MVNQAAQLERIARAVGGERPAPAVRIYSLAREFDWWFWLCERCKAAMLAAGWQVREAKDPPHQLTCDRCRNVPRGAAA